MTVNALTEALRDKIAEVLKNYRLPAKNGAPRCPNVFIGDLPPKRSGGNVDDYPFVIVRATNGKIAHVDGEAETTVVIIIGCFSAEFDAYVYCTNVMQSISAALSTLPDDTLDNRYVLQDSIDWTLYDDASPQCQIDMYTTWAYHSPQPVLSFDRR